MDVLRIAPLFAPLLALAAAGGAWAQASEVSEREQQAIEASVNVADQLDDPELGAVIEHAQQARRFETANAGRVDRRPAILAPPSEELAADDVSESAEYLRSLDR